MLKQTVFAAALCAAAAAQAAPSLTATTDPARCEALAREADGLREQAGAAGAKKAAGFLAGMAGRALVYAPGIDVGGGRLGQFAGQEAESALHRQAASGLDKVRQGGAAADAGAGKTRLKAIAQEREQLSCPKA